MGPSRLKDKEFQRIIDVYSSYMNLQIQRFNLAKYGLDPEDILQEVRVRIWKLLCSNKLILSPSAYIRRIINSAVIDQLRKRRRDDTLFLHEKQKRIAENGFPYCREAIQQRAFEQTVGKAIEQLMESRRQVVKLYLLNLNIQEISTYMNWSLDKTRNLLYRGFSDLRKMLRDVEIKNDN